MSVLTLNGDAGGLSQHALELSLCFLDLFASLPKSTPSKNTSEIPTGLFPGEMY